MTQFRDADADPGKVTPLRQGGMVDLVYADDEHRRAARVREVGHQYAILAPFGAARGDEGERCEAAIEALGPAGLVRLHGLIRSAGPGTLRFDPVRPYEELQRRRHPRVPTARSVLLQTGSGRTSHGQACDLSVGGMRLRTPETLAVGQDVRVAISWDEGLGWVGGPAVVLRDDGDGIYAVSFEVWPDGITHALRALVAAESRAA